MKKPKTPEQMFDLRQAAIRKALADKDLNIRTCWAINCAVAFAPKDGWGGITISGELFLIESNARMFLEMFKKLRNELVNERARELELKEQAGEDFARGDQGDLSGFGKEIHKVG